MLERGCHSSSFQIHQRYSEVVSDRVAGVDLISGGVEFARLPLARRGLEGRTGSQYKEHPQAHPVGEIPGSGFAIVHRECDRLEFPCIRIIDREFLHIRAVIATVPEVHAVDSCLGSLGPEEKHHIAIEQVLQVVTLNGLPHHCKIARTYHRVEGGAVYLEAESCRRPGLRLGRHVAVLRDGMHHRPELLVSPAV